MGQWVRRVLGGSHRPQNPTDRAKKNGVKRSILVEADGGPLAIVVAGANVPDFKLLGGTLDAIVVERPEPTEEVPQHLCLGDKGYDNRPTRKLVKERNYVAHIRLRRPHPTDRRRETRRGGREEIPSEALGGGAHAGVAQRVPGDSGALRQEGGELPGAGQASLYPALVSPPASTVPFEIVS